MARNPLGRHQRRRADARVHAANATTFERAQPLRPDRRSEIGGQVAVD